MKRVGCLGCEYCYTKWNGECVQKDDMKEVETKIMVADMIVIVSSVYYFNYTGRMQCVIDRFYTKHTIPVKKYALIVSSYLPNIYSGIVESYKLISCLL